MKMKLRSLIAAAALCTLCVGQASALEYTVDAPEDYLFGTPTSEGTVYEQESNNVDRGKNTALIDRKSTRLNSSHIQKSRMPSSA